MKTVFIDMDGVVADYPATATLEDMFEPGYFFNLKPVNSMIELARSLDDPYILSACLTERCQDEKDEWLDIHMPFIPKDHRIFTPCGVNKFDYLPEGVSDRPILIDDHTPNLIKWESCGGIGIKVLNGINGKGGTWQGTVISA